jgi:hypothetical protein
MSKNDNIREQIISENNDAQINLESFLDHLDSTHTTDLRFNFSLHGDLDFSILSDRGFTKITSIIFEKEGEITNIRNLPETLITLELNNQLINGFENLPNNIEVLYVSDNSISKFDGSIVPKLRILNISNNELTEMVNLPESLVTIECENNQLRRIDLATTPILKTLVCSNNPILVLEHVPSSLNNLVMENNPFIEVDRSLPSKNSNKTNLKKFDYRESINEYMRLKNSYETKIRKLKRIAFERGATRRESIHKARSVKIPCINCGRNVGTQFSHKDNEYRATCGDNSKPCNLDIHIFGGDYLRMDDMIESFNAEIQIQKQSIIEQKMDTLFKYISEEESVKTFNEKLKYYNDISDGHATIMEHSDKQTNSIEREHRLNKKNDDIYKIKENINTLIQQYQQQNNRELLIAAIKIYVKDLMPEIQNLRLIKYVNIFMENISNDPPVSKLVSYELSTYRMDFIYGNDPRVIKFIID